MKLWQSKTQKRNAGARIPTSQLSDSICPRCGSEEISRGFVGTGDNTAIQSVACRACGAEWRNVYDFAAVTLDDAVIEVGKGGA